ncbi:MAG TPA: GTPase Era [Chitinivibrionales bacterium]|nr:GTPase Era [Chitinivibrionales bacterium]
MQKPSRSAFIALVGRPNCGKSTLMNTVLGEELSIVSTMPQTTRKNLRGIYNADGLQLVFIDTPGIHRGKHAFNERMLAESAAALSDNADVVCYIVDLAREFGGEEDAVAGIVAKSKLPAVVLFNKKDICDGPDAMVKTFFGRHPALANAPHAAVNAKEPATKDIFLKLLDPFIPEGPAYFPADDLTDANTRFFAAEYIRKQIIYNTKEEVPHAAFVEVTGYRESPNCHHVDATIYVETDGQKGIIIGKGGKLIKKIQERAAQDLQKLTGVPASIQCHVRVQKGWRDDERFLRKMGYGGE